MKFVMQIFFTVAFNKPLCLSMLSLFEGGNVWKQAL